ncbi:MAG: DUF115 domain-containing protein [Spirochaetales bacterium]|nr:DUF115 domain-containing protein [Spirochaetales bacterium]
MRSDKNGAGDKMTGSASQIGASSQEGAGSRAGSGSSRAGWYPKNREILERRFPGIEKRLDAAEAAVPEDFEFLETPDGGVSFKSGGSWFHSSRAPLREASRLIESSIPADCPYCLFYGFGLAWHLDEFVKRHPGVPFAVIEPDLGLFNGALECRDLSALFMNPDFSLALATPAEALPALFDNLRTSEIHTCMIRSAVTRNRSYFDEAEGVVRDYLARKEINSHTLNRFSRLWVSNICRNLSLSADFPGVSSLAGRFEGIPALLLAAGPTLTAILPRLKELREKMLLVCVDTALKACLRAGIEPDVLVLTDPQYWNSRHLDRCHSPNSILITDLSTYPSALRGEWSKAFFCSSPFPLGEFFESRTEVKGKLKSGGSVATAAWDFIRQSGIDEIYCAGLDLAFPEGETHYRGSTFEERLHSFSTRTSGIETSSWHALMGGNPYWTRDLKGRPVLTDQRMKIYIHWFAEQMGLFPDVATRQLSDMGAGIRGMSWFDPANLDRLPERRMEIESILEEIRQIPCKTDTESLRSAVEELTGELDELIGLCSSAADLTRRLMESPSEEVHTAILNSLNAIDAAILDRESREIAGFILAPILEEHMNRRGTTPHEVLKNSLSLYNELEKSLNFHRQKIDGIDL